MAVQLAARGVFHLNGSWQGEVRAAVKKYFRSAKELLYILENR